MAKKQTSTNRIRLKTKLLKIYEFNPNRTSEETNKLDNYRPRRVPFLLVTVT